MRFIAMVFLGLTLVGGAQAQEAGSGWLGVIVQDLTKEEADALGWKVPRGARVVNLVPGGPAEAAGVQAGDVVWSIDGVEIVHARALVEAVSERAAGTEVQFAIQRGGHENQLAVKLGARPTQLAATKPEAAQEAGTGRISIDDLNAQVVRLLGQGKYAEASDIAAQTLAAAGMVLGHEHPQTL